MKGVPWYLKWSWMSTCLDMLFSQRSSQDIHTYCSLDAQSTRLGLPDNQQPQKGQQGQVRRDVNVFHCTAKGVIVLLACCHGYTVSTGRISAVKRRGPGWLLELLFLSQPPASVCSLHSHTFLKTPKATAGPETNTAAETSGGPHGGDHD